MLDSTVQAEIQAEFVGCIQRTLVRLKAEDTLRPFHAALLTPEAIAWSRLERSFSTSFGQSVIERISRLVAIGAGADAAENQRATSVTLTSTQWEEAERIVRDARTAGSGYVANWEADLERMRTAGGFGVPSTRRVISDLWWQRDGVEHFMSIKTVKPNIDQTAQAKLDLLHLAASGADKKVYFGLYYNPFGERQEDYSWSPPARIFNLAPDEPVLIGRDYWDALGGDGTYEEILQLAAAAGQIARPAIVAYGQSVVAEYSDIAPAAEAPDFRG